MILPDFNPSTELLNIGEFARASRLSHKALRLYDELGLLPPFRVDKLTGYRYYATTQLEQARLISLLRQLDLSLTEIRNIQNTPEAQQAEAIRALWANTKAQFIQRDELARYVIQKLQGETNLTQHHEIKERFVLAQHFASLTRKVYVKDLPSVIQDGIRDLHALISGQGAEFAGAPVVIYHGEVNADSDGPIEICWPYRGPLAPSGEISLREEPAHHEAFVVLTKAQFEFPAILSAYDAAAHYAQAHGKSGPLPCREVYPYDWDQAGENQPAGEVAWPFIPQEA